MSDKKFERIIIKSLDTDVYVEADYNPKELSFEKSAGWTEESGGKGMNCPNLQFTNGKAIKMSVELLFDAYEKETKDVRPAITKLMSFVHVVDKLERPPRVQVFWGGKDVLFNNGEFKGVVESVSTKYTMFTADGTPCRATATVSMTQAEALPFNESGGYDGSAYVVKEWKNPSEITEKDMEAILKMDANFKIENATFPLKLNLSGSVSVKDGKVKTNVSGSASVSKGGAKASVSGNVSASNGGVKASASGSASVSSNGVKASASGSASSKGVSGSASASMKR